MKRYLKGLCFLLCAVLLISGGTFAASAETAEDDWYAAMTARYEELLPDLGIRADEWEAEMAKCSPAEQRVMQYYFTVMPMSDVVSIDFSLLRGYAEHAVTLRETLPWTRALDEDTFLCYVASYRVDNEPIEDNRPFFYSQVFDRLEGKTLEEAALEVNRWCGEQATYAETDQRSASPMGMYNGGSGRCGEEVNFVVNVLRSVGIPARVFNVNWTTVPGEHAFVEVLVDGAWHYMGACEPEPVLDSGWFTSRLGTLITTESYTRSEIGVGQPYAVTDGGTVVVNNVGDYTETKQVTVTVLDEKGKPAPDTRVEIMVVQHSVYLMTNVALTTDENGKVSYSLGLGSAAVAAYRNGDWRAAWLAQNETEATLSFAEQPTDNVWKALPIRYNGEETANKQTYTDAERDAFWGGEDFNEVRAANHAQSYDEKKAAKYPDCETSLRNAGRNFNELINFLSVDEDPMRAALVAGLSDKDSREVTAAVLEDLLDGAENVRGELNDEDFIQGVLLPVFDYVCPTAHRLAVQEMFTEEEMADFRAHPESLYAWFSARVSSESVREAKGLTPNLAAVLRTGFCPEDDQAASFLQLARAVGVPVKEDIEAETGGWLYLAADGDWVSADTLLPETEQGGAEQARGEGTVRYEVSGSEAYIGLNWGILDTDDYQAYWLVEEGDEDTEFTLPAGDYAMIMTEMQTETEGTLHYNRFTLEDGETVTLALPERKQP